MIRFSCSCGRQLQAGEANIGQKAKCPICGEITIVPASDEPRPSQRASEPLPEREDRGGYRPREEEPPPRDDRPPRRDDRDEDDEPYRRSRNRFARGPSGTCSEAQTSLILGVVGLFCCNLAGPIAIILGIVALNKINASGGELEGRGQAIAGIVLGSIGVAVLVIYLVLSAMS